ncbi:MAG: zinc metallopeptidase, partial [Clostridia bacterium]
WDWTMLLVIPGLLLGMWAQHKVSSSFRKYSSIHTQKGITADEVSRQLLSHSGNSSVSVREVSGKLTDHFDPRTGTLRLSESVYGSNSVSAIGVAAHECGHAMQQQEGYLPLKLRSAIVPMVNIGSNLYFPIFLLGLVFSWQPLVYVGIGCFALTLLFSLVTLPVEFNASKRAMAVLESGGYVTQDELVGVRAVLNAAAMTYVAAAISSLLQLVRLLIISRDQRD